MYSYWCLICCLQKLEINMTFQKISRAKSVLLSTETSISCSQWGFETRTRLDIQWSKIGQLLNGPNCKWFSLVYKWLVAKAQPFKNLTIWLQIFKMSGFWMVCFVTSPHPMFYKYYTVGIQILDAWIQNF